MAEVTCEAPFERGPQLCGICRLQPGLAGAEAVLAARGREPGDAGAAAAGRAASADADASVVVFGETGSGKEVRGAGAPREQPAHGRSRSSR